MTANRHRRTGPIEAYGYPAVGQCIYCGTNEGRLTKEHIIARAIGGNVTLPHSSCVSCAKITQEIEQFCFKNMLGAFRVRMGFPTSKPKERPTGWRSDVLHIDGRLEVRNVPISEHPAALCVPTFVGPAALTGMPPSDNCGQWTYIINPDAVRKFSEGTRIGVGQFHATKYARMLAKIAHGLGVAEVGLQSFRPLLPDFILGKTTLPADYFMGCIENDLPPDECLHHARVEQTQMGWQVEYLVAKIRLFAKFGAPQYHVVIGEILS